MKLKCNNLVIIIIVICIILKRKKKLYHNFYSRNKHNFHYLWIFYMSFSFIHFFLVRPPSSARCFFFALPQISRVSKEKYFEIFHFSEIKQKKMNYLIYRIYENISNLSECFTINNPTTSWSLMLFKSNNFFLKMRI